MKDKEIFKKVGVIISELNNQYQYLAENPGGLNEFELELLRANGKFLTDHIEILQRLVLSKRPAEESKPAEPENEAPAVAEPVTPPEPEKKAVHATEPAPVAEPEAAAEPAPERREQPEPPAVTPVKSEENAEPTAVTREVIISEHTVAIDIPADSPSQRNDGQPATIRDQFAAALGNPATIAGSLGNQPITDLKAAISLNDKLLFIKELFNSYSLAYNEAIELVNRSASLEAARNFLQVNYAVKNDWESHPATVEKLYELLRRKFEG